VTTLSVARPSVIALSDPLDREAVTMPTPLFRLDLTRHLDRALQLTANRPKRVQLVRWCIRYLAHTDGLDVVVIDKHHPARVVQVVGAAWLDSIRTALASHEAPNDVVSVVERVAYAAEAEVFWRESRRCHQRCRDGLVSYPHAASMIAWTSWSEKVDGPPGSRSPKHGTPLVVPVLGGMRPRARHLASPSPMWMA
jgi:hypothetical protein